MLDNHAAFVKELRAQCQKFATALLDHTRSSYELEILLNHDPTGPVYQHGERMHLNRLKLAIKYRQKKFVAHPNVQQLLASIWYEGLPGFRQMNIAFQLLEVCRIGLMFPVFALAYIICPCSNFSLKMRKPFIKFICTSFSYFTFLFLLILASQRIEVVIAEWFHNERLKKYLSNDVTTKRGFHAHHCGMDDTGLGGRLDMDDMWNVVDFVTNFLYVATIALRIVAYYKVQNEIKMGSITAHLPREHWDTWDPMLISEGLFAAANIFFKFKTSLYFFCESVPGTYFFAFSCGANQLLWYYADLEKQRCYNEHENLAHTLEKEIPIANFSAFANKALQQDINHCLAWRRFANLWETCQTLFWAIFGLVDLDNFELTGIKEFTRFSGLLMFGSFSVINIIVLLNLLIAMMNHSYQLISVSSEKADIEWKFARSKLWISYFEEGGTCPPPFNIIPTPKSIYYLIRWIYVKLCGRTNKIKKEHLKTRKVREASERDYRYQSIMRNLVRRYVTLEQRKAENEGVTEDDVNEIKNDISAFRFELIEIMRSSGMNTTSATGPSGAAGKKNRQKERRLMKGFNLSTSSSTPTGNALSHSTSTNPYPSRNGSQSKKISLNVPSSDISIDMSSTTGLKSPANSQNGSSTYLSNNGKRSPISKFARFAKMATSKSIESQDGASTDEKSQRWASIMMNRASHKKFKSRLLAANPSSSELEGSRNKLTRSNQIEDNSNEPSSTEANTTHIISPSMTTTALDNGSSNVTNGGGTTTSVIVERPISPSSLVKTQNGSTSNVKIPGGIKPTNISGVNNSGWL
ncbi:TRPC4 [Lepeophtheirus salmonis]|uniref:TRPC4 n=1 Tax=Lepeophtheirus salmonis TaxID=72036 RepID=A0A7R8CU59_LEPSM|nr:TRPC4 [Lepeophtheirus salmonis]CAF2896989.1 TRPC4 [Lepeophtheirus salmonis]